MKTCFLVSLCAIATLSAYADDIIVMKNGDLINAKVLEITQTEVKFKKAKRLDGPLYTIAKSDILAINYEDGEKETFSEVLTTTENADKAETITLESAIPDANNTLLLTAYNKRDYSYSGKKINLAKPGKNAKHWMGTLGVDESSVLSTDEVSIRFIAQKETQYKNVNGFLGHYVILITNNTNSFLYVDLGNTFRVDQTGLYKVYFDGSSVSLSHGDNNGIGLNLGSVASFFGIGGAIGALSGGINIGSNSGTTYNKTFNTQRVLAIPPHASLPLSKEEWADNIIRISTDECFWECNDSDLSYPQIIDIKKNELREYNDIDSSPMSYKYYVTYSTSENFQHPKTIYAGVYLKDVVGIDHYGKMSAFRPSYGCWTFDFNEFVINYFGDTVSDFCIPVYGDTQMTSSKSSGSFLLKKF